MNMGFRFEIHDDLGCIRKFLVKETANNWLRNRKELRLVTIPIVKEPKFDVYSMEECLF